MMDPDEVPDDVEIQKMLMSRKRELESLVNEVEKKMPKQASQRLPRVMRRRAASNNAKRIPKSCRSAWFRTQTGQDKVSAAKEKKRRQLKKHIPRNKQLESINRRKNRADRSLLHVWFAKRFKMQRMDGMMIPMRNTTKNQRSLFRKSKNHCVYYYMSAFFRSLEVVGVDLKEFVNSLSGDINGQHHLRDLQTKGFCYINIFDKNNKLICPIEVFVVADKIEVWSHFSASDSLQVHLKSFFGDDKVSSSSSELQRFSLVGSEAVNKIKSFLGIDVTFTDSSNFFHFENKIFFKHFIGNRSVIDVIVPQSEARKTWSDLVKNRGHFVGGWRNLVMLYFNAGQRLFPTFGYLKNVQDNLGDREAKILIQENLFKKISNHPSSLLPSLLEELSHSCQSLLPILVVSKGKGVPSPGSVILVPDLKDIDVLDKNEPLDSTITRRECGFIEFGEYCMEVGSGKGIGYVTIEGLVGLLRNRQAFQEQTSSREDKSTTEITCLFRTSKSDCLRKGYMSFIQTTES